MGGQVGERGTEGEKGDGIEWRKKKDEWFLWQLEQHPFLNSAYLNGRGPCEPSMTSYYAHHSYRVFHAKVAIINRRLSATRNDKVNLKIVLERSWAPIFCCKISLFCEQLFALHIVFKIVNVFRKTIYFCHIVLDFNKMAPMCKVFIVSLQFFYCDLLSIQTNGKSISIKFGVNLL